MKTNPIAILTSLPSLPNLRYQATEACSGRRQLAVHCHHWTKLVLGLDNHLPLCHSGEISHRGYCAQNPKQFGVRMDLLIVSKLYNADEYCIRRTGRKSLSDSDLSQQQ
jgi:hypothetical protein